MISTPPATHYELTKAALLAGKTVLLEKLAVLDLHQLDNLYKIADQNHVMLHIAFHASFAMDLRWFISHKDEIAPYPYHKITCEFYDPYMTNGVIQTERIPLGGCYIDSGVNALSVCDKLIFLSSFKLKYFNESKKMSKNQRYIVRNMFFGPMVVAFLLKLHGIKSLTRSIPFLNFKEHLTLLI